jgi:acyl-CoA dehydrogenase
MPAALPEKLAPYASRLRHLLDVELPPIERLLLDQDLPACIAALQSLRATLRAEGLWAPTMPRELGGMGLTLTEFAPLSEWLGTSVVGHHALNCNAPDVGNMELLHSHGNALQKQTFLEPLVRGEITSCFGMTEPGRAGSNPTWLDTGAVREGDSYRLNGRKWFTTAGDGAAFSIVMAVTNPDAPPHLRASMIIVPTNTPGYETVHELSIMGERGAGWFSHSEVRLTDCVVPAANLIGGEGMGFKLAQERLGPGRIHHCMRWIGICERAMALSLAYATGRELSPGEALADQPLTLASLAESRAEIDAARALVLDTARQIDAAGARAAKDPIAAIKFFTAGVLQRTLDRAIQLHGGYGLTDSTPLAFWYRHERAARIYDGPDEVHKLALGRSLVKAHRASHAPKSVAPRETKPPREGEAPDLDKLCAWLKADKGIELAPASVTLTQFPAGHSNLTFLLETPRGEFVLRRPPIGAAAKHGHDMAREFRVLSAVYPPFPKVPRPIALCEDSTVLGAPFYLMERVKGVILRGPKPKGHDLSPERVRQLCGSLVATLAGIHRLDVEATGLSQLGHPDGYLERQVNGWVERYEKSWTNDVPAMEHAGAWLKARLPQIQPLPRATLVHNDFKFDNLVLDPADLGQVRAVLDWELATVGDPRMDLGTTLAYWITASDPPDLQNWSFGPNSLPGAYTRSELVAAWEGATGFRIDDPVFFYAFGLYKVAVIAQQIYARFVKGHTHDERFGLLGFAVQAISGQALQAIESARID